MCTTRTLHFALSITILPSLWAQSNLRLVDPAALVTSTWTTDPTTLAGMQAAGLDDATMNKVLKHGEPSKLPAGLLTDSARTENRAALVNMNLERVSEIPFGESIASLVKVPMMANLHMPEELRAPGDFFLLVREEGLAEVVPPPQRPAASRGPSWKGRPQARIRKPDGVFATYDLQRDAEALDRLRSVGLSDAEIAAVVYRSHESNWPEGIDRFDKRYPKLKEFRKMAAYVAAQWDNKVLLIIPAEANRSLAQDLRPYLDIYMVYDAESVAVAGKR